MQPENYIKPFGPTALDAAHAEAIARGEPDAVSMREYIAIFYRWRWLVAACFAVIFALGTVYTLTRRPVYESAAKIVVVGTRSGAPTSENDIPLISDLQALTRSRSVETQVEIMSSADLLDEAFRNLRPKIRERGFRSDSIPDWAYRIAGRKNTDIIVVTARAYTPKAAAALANTIVGTYFTRDLEQNNQATRQARIYAGKKMTLAQRQLEQANAELARFKQRTGLIAPEVQLTKSAERMTELSFELDASRAEAISLRREAAALQSSLVRQRPNVVTNTTFMRNPQYNASLERLDKLNADRIELLQEYMPGSREIGRIEGQIKHEEEHLRKVAETMIGSNVRARNPVHDDLLMKYASGSAAAAASNARVRALGSELIAREQAARALPERERQFTGLVQNVTLLQRTYEMLSGKYYALLLSEQAKLPNGMLVSSARVSNIPAYPRMERNIALFLALAIALAVLAVLVAERLDNRVHDQNTVEQMTGLSVLSIVPEAIGDSPRLLGSDGHHGALLESFRILRNNLSFASVGRQVKLIAITSPGRGDGKSTSVSNLAFAMAIEGKRIILVDADLRRPSLHRFIGVSREAGLTTVLTGSTTLENTIVHVGEANFDFLPSGPTPPNPAEFLNSHPSRELFEKLAQQYDVVLIDCPPATGLSDMQVISTFADAVLLVVSMDQTLKPHLYATLRALIQADAKLIGLLLNRMDVRRRQYGYYYYYYRSYYDYSVDKDALEAQTASRRTRSKT